MLFMPVGLILCFYCRYSSSYWNQTDFLHWKCILVLMMVLSVPSNHGH